VQPSVRLPLERVDRRLPRSQRVERLQRRLRAVNQRVDDRDDRPLQSAHGRKLPRIDGIVEKRLEQFAGGGGGRQRVVRHCRTGMGRASSGLRVCQRNDESGVDHRGVPSVRRRGSLASWSARLAFGCEA
jgi:hypothetical protein